MSTADRTAAAARNAVTVALSGICPVRSRSMRRRNSSSLAIVVGVMPSFCIAEKRSESMKLMVGGNIAAGFVGATTARRRLLDGASSSAFVEAA